ncbi:pilus assembly protein TadG-related protein [Metapseudomonas boanensis]|uniref:Pilus assembly protein n=1 Tax=Metapseudomonas boanensis TaxID=2822138 RepID=A0ABS5XF96_9GAMM|nr:pilus assembly protein TadG-related protein [Pseudomonas boanensis]MBT8766349.1 pilus assembly protein [Pseudomonas boanensis]
MMNPQIPKPFNALPRRQRGSVLVLVAVAMLAMLAMAALALDGGHMLVNKTRLQNATDAAALSAAKRMSQVQGMTGAISEAQAAAYKTFELNADAVGNGELKAAMGATAKGFIKVEFSNSVYGAFSETGPADASFVRVSVPDYPLTHFFWGIRQFFNDGVTPDKTVAAIATAGPAPSQPCKIEPLLVCGNPDESAYNPKDGLYWGFKSGDVTVLKSAAQNTDPIGPGNFQLLDFGSGGNTVRDGLAGGIEDCNVVGETATTEPGNKVGPVSQGLNTRFGEGSTTQYPADYVTTYDKWISLDGEVAKFNGSPVLSTNGELTAGTASLFDYVDWKKAYKDARCPGDNCTLVGGKPNRRILNIVIGDCTGKEAGEFSGKSDIPVMGFACYFTLQPVQQGGQTSQIFGQFVDECNGDSVPSSTPWDDSGPQIIQLYKTYINTTTPSTDS